MQGTVMVRGLSYRFRDSMRQALSDVSLEVGRGEFVAVTGPSGCGKSTLALAIGGYLFHQYDGEAEGSVCVAGLDARRAPVYDLAEVVGLVQQNPEAQFCTLNVDDEVAFGLENRSLPAEEIRQRMAWALGVAGATHLAGRSLAALSGGEKQRVAIAAVLAARPQVLILDEPTSNLDPTATAEVFRTIANLREAAGVTVIIIEHKLGYLRPFNPRLVAMEAGRIVRDGPVTSAGSFTTKDTRRTSDLQPLAGLCGACGSNLPLRSEPARDCAEVVEPVVRVDGLYAGHQGSLALHGLSLRVAAGELVAVMGDNGAGKTTLLLSLLGLLKPQRGRVEVFGCDTRRTPVSRLAREVAFVFQNPDHQLFADSVWLEATLAPRNLGTLDAATEARVGVLLSRSNLGERKADHPYRLSYGEKRRLNLASVLGMAPRLILLDELLIGQDPANAAYLMGLLCEHVAAGAAVIMAAHDPEIVRAYATRVVFLDGGRLLVDAPPEEAFAQLAALGRTAYLPLEVPLGAPAASRHGPDASGQTARSFRSEAALNAVRAQAPEPPLLHPRARPRRLAYQPGHSALHRLHPLLKAAWLIFGTVFVFAVPSPWAVLAALALIAVGLGLARVRLRGVRGSRLFGTTALLLALLQLVFVRQGPVLVRIGPLTVTANGAEAAIYVAGRFLAVILLSYLFVLTTEPGELAYALVRAGLPYRYGFALITALRLVPVFEREAEIVYGAQLARGVAYDIRSPQRLLRLARQFSLPLLVSALSKVDALAVSMEGRCFGKQRTRTYLRQVRLQRLDWVAATLLAVAAVGTLVGRLAL